MLLTPEQGIAAIRTLPGRGLYPLGLNGVVAQQETQITVPSHYGRVWTAVGARSTTTLSKFDIERE